MTQTLEELKAEGKTLEILNLFPRQGEWTEEAYFSLPETNRIIELSEGRLIITPSPTTQHQTVLGELFALIRDYVLANKSGKIVISPMDVRLWEGNIRQPDIVFMSNEHRDRITEKYWGVPDLVMEILSESTAKEDKTNKFYEYAKAGVQEYWIADPAERSIEVYVLEKGTYRLLGKWNAGGVARSEVLTGLAVAVSDIIG